MATSPVVPHKTGTPDIGKLTRLESTVSTTEYTGFDILGRLTASRQTTDGVTYGNGTTDSLMTYTYNLSGALIEQQYPSGRKVRNELDATGDLAKVASRKNAGHSYWTFADRFSYNAAGAVTDMQLGNGTTPSAEAASTPPKTGGELSTTSNSRLQPTQIALGATKGTTNLLDLDYSYGTSQNNGNVLSQTITVPTVGASPGFTAVQTYNYDSVNRLKDATEMITPHGGSQVESWKQTFEFDRYGNRRFDQPNTTMPTSFANPAITNPTISPNTNKITSTGYQFDAAGNTTRDASDRKFTYDSENKQVKVESLTAGTQTVTGTVGEYVYDGDGRRVKKRAYENNVLIEETVFAYDAFGELVAEYSNEVASTQDAKVAYLTNDHLGSPRINTDINGNVTARHDYHPFGDQLGTSHRAIARGYLGDEVRKKFTGYELDAETGLNFAQARMYVSSAGRFSVPDPILSSSDEALPQSWNRYLYCLNSPYKLIDPSGLIWVYRDSEDGKTRHFDWVDSENDIPTGWTLYTGSKFFVGKSEGVFLGAKGKWKKVSLEEAGLGQLDEFLRGAESPLSDEDKAKLTRDFTNRVRAFHWEDDFVASLAGTTLGGLANRGLKGLAALFSSTATRVETAELAGMLRQAMAGKGNFGIGKATVDQANAMGRAWVGEGYHIASDGVTLISKDGLRQFRPPSYKPNLGKVQANFEWRPENLKQWQGNGHLDIR